jgi:hypothetical protein
MATVEWREGTPWRPLDLREDARGGGVPLDPWRGDEGRLRRTGEDAMALAAVIFFL